MPLPYTPDRELNPPETIGIVEMEKCIICFDYFDEDLLTSDKKCSYCSNPENHEL